MWNIPSKERLEKIGNESLIKNEKPFALSFFPGGEGKTPKSFSVLNKKMIEISAIKKAQNNNDWIIRLFNSSSKKQSAQLKLSVLKLNQKLSFRPFEIKTLRISNRGKVSEVNLIEEA